MFEKFGTYQKKFNKVTKVLSQRLRKRFYETLGTIVILHFKGVIL